MLKNIEFDFDMSFDTGRVSRLLFFECIGMDSELDF